MVKLMLVVVLALFSFSNISGCWTSKVPEGTTLEGLDVSGLKYEELQEKKETLIKEWNSREITLLVEDEQNTVTAGEVGLNFYFDNDEIMEEAGDYYLEVELSEETAREKIEELFTVVLEEPADAELYVEDEPVITEHEEGRHIALDQVGEVILENAREDEIELPVEPLLPDVTTEDVKNMGVKEVVASFSTEFNARVHNRSNNIALAAEKIDHTMLAPGEVFSFNETAGPYSSDRGFLTAPVFRDGEITEGRGGGVCQVSSTVYNAALLSGLEIVERYPHSLPVWYVPLARDAAVSFGGGDLKFENSLQNYIYIRMHVNRDRGVVTATFFGTREKVVEVGSRIEEKIPPPEEEEEVEGLEEKKIEEEGQPGYEARSWRVVDGEWEHLSRDRYNPIKRIIKIPAEKEKEEKEAEEKEPEEKEKEEKKEDLQEERENEQEAPEKERDEAAAAEEEENDEEQEEKEQ